MNLDGIRDKLLKFPFSSFCVNVAREGGGAWHAIIFLPRAIGMGHSTFRHRLREMFSIMIVLRQYVSS